ncbi:hypothetical protein BU24DRAFT_315275, partial [Aaosphaeria arxii CBS 175.79]
PNPPSESIAHDDLCPVCHLLLYEPVRTQCNHLLCGSCMAQWADASSLNHISPSNVDIDLADIEALSDRANLQANCPMCRTATTAALDRDLARTLEEKYPDTWRERAVEEDEARVGVAGIESMVILIGNKHSLVRASPGSDNQHDWTFFVKCSRSEIVHQIRINLHPTFHPPQLTLDGPPFEVRRVGWGYFNIEAKILLKSPYRWVTEGTDAGTDILTLDWMLNFEDRGRQGRVRAKVKK